MLGSSSENVVATDDDQMMLQKVISWIVDLQIAMSWLVDFLPFISVTAIKYAHALKMCVKHTFRLIISVTVRVCRTRFAASALQYNEQTECESHYLVIQIELNIGEK